jgi:hypothetical protein
LSVFKYSLGPWVDDRGQTLPLTCVARDSESDVTIVDLFRYWETGEHLYGYWGSGIFGKVFVTEVRGSGEPDPMWEMRLGPFRYDPPRAEEPSVAERSACIAWIVDALSQWPDGDLSRAVPGVVLRRIEVKQGWP